MFRMNYDGKFSAGMDACFDCGKSGHRIRDSQLHTIKGKEGK